MKQSLEQPELELNRDGSVHGVIIYQWGISPGCSTYCKDHVKYILDHGWDIIPRHNSSCCSGFECYHGAGMVPHVESKK